MQVLLELMEDSRPALRKRALHCLGEWQGHIPAFAFHCHVCIITFSAADNAAAKCSFQKEAWVQLVDEYSAPADAQRTQPTNITHSRPLGAPLGLPAE